MTPHCIGQLQIYPALNEIGGPAGRVRLEPQAVVVLSLLAGEPERVWSRDELLERAWKGRVVSDATLTGVISRLRRALGEAGITDCCIETRSKRGYRLVVEARVAPPGLPGRGRVLSFAILGISFLLVGVYAAGLFRDQPQAVRLDFNIVTPDGETTGGIIWVENAGEGSLRVFENPPLYVRVIPRVLERDRLRLRVEASNLSHWVGLEHVTLSSEANSFVLRSPDGKGRYAVQYVATLARLPPSEENSQEKRKQTAGKEPTPP